MDESLRTQAEVTQALSTSTQSLREALANPKARGQWGERMAEDVLRLAGFIEHVNYEKQTAVEGTRALPDYTFTLPKGHALYMDVKFPLNAYLRYLEAGTDAERQAHREAFLRDVKARVRELAQRDYPTVGDRPAVDYVLLFLPNEAIAGFIHEHDPDLVEQALGQKVVLCSPLTLFAFLGVIRQAFDNFVIEQTSDEILNLLGRFGQQWEKYTRVAGERAAQVRRRAQGAGPPRRATPAAAGEAARPAQRASPQTRPGDRRGVRAGCRGRRRPGARPTRRPRRLILKGGDDDAGVDARRPWVSRCESGASAGSRPRWRGRR